MRLALTLVLSLLLSGCLSDTGALLYCMANQHNINRKCQ